MILKILCYILFAFICACACKSSSPEDESKKADQISRKLVLLSLLNGEWTYKDDPNLILSISKDSVYQFYHGKIDDRSAITIDSTIDLERYFSSDSSFDFTTENGIWGLEIFEKSQRLGTTEFLIIYIDKDNLEIGDHGGSHHFEKRFEKRRINVDSLH